MSLSLFLLTEGLYKVFSAYLCLTSIIDTLKLACNGTAKERVVFCLMQVPFNTTA
jgi:hypothetical protein